MAHRWLFSEIHCVQKQQAFFAKPTPLKIRFSGLVGTDTIVVKVGKAKPEVAITTPGNTLFFWKNKPVTYSVRNTDKEEGKIDLTTVYVGYN